MRLVSIIKSAIVAVAAVSHGAALTGRQLRILCLGDSITVGINAEDQGGYRKPLLGMLAGNYVDMVGAQYAGIFRDPQAGAVSGAFVDEIKGFYELAAPSRPNVILVHAGTNDNRLTRTDQDITDAANRLDNLLNTTRIHNPDALLVVAQIVPVKMSRVVPNQGDYEGRVLKYNAKVLEIVNRKIAAGWHIISAPIHDALDAETDIGAPDSTDSLHPNVGGYQKMADEFYKGIVAGAEKNWIPEVDIPYGHGTKACTKALNYQYFNSYGDAPYPGTDLVSRKALFTGYNCRDIVRDANHCACVDGGSGTDQIYVFPKAGSCAEMNTARTSAVHFADLNGDGKEDYIYVGPKGELSSSLSGRGVASGFGVGHMVFTGQSGSFTGRGVISRSEIRFADINGNSRADYLRVEASGKVTAWYNNVVYSQSDSQPQAHFSRPATIFSGKVGATSYPGAGIRFADLDGDNKADMLFVGVAGDISLFPNLGPSVKESVSTTFGAPVLLRAAGEYTREGTLLADVNGDGLADIVQIDRSSPSGKFKFFLNQGKSNGKITFGSALTADPNFEPSAHGEGVHFADPIGLGRATFVSVNSTTSAAYGWYPAC